MRPQEDAPTAARGLGLRTKLSLGFVVLLAILLAVGVESITLLDQLGGSIDVILRENYKSVIAAERMKESLERMDSGALFALAGEEQQGRALAAEHRPRFEEALRVELGNITLPGEGERAERLRQLFAAYVPVLDRILDPAVPLDERRALYFGRLYPTFQRIKMTADEILQMNQQNMAEANDRARRRAAEASRRMALLLLAGTAFAGLCVFFLSRSILGPLERLTRAAGEIERGNLDLAVPISSRDEIGQLAAAFNSMAGGLRDLRESEQARLLRAQHLARTALDAIPEAVAVLSPDRRVELANRAAASLLGLQPGEPLPEHGLEWLPALLQRAESGRLTAPSAETTVRLPGNVGHEGERFVKPRVTVLRDTQNRPEALLLVLEDATDRLRGGAVNARLLANAAHDLEKALAPIHEALEVAGAERQGPLAAGERQRLEGARAEAERLGEMAKNLRATARLEEARQQLRPEPVAPGELIAGAVRQTEAGYREEQVKLATEVDPAAPAALADRERAELVLTSLLRNALAHSAGGGSVTVKAEPWEGRVRFAVADSGGGVPADHRERLFEPFYQVPGTQDLGGVGLGLSIARDAVQAHGGEIHCESEEGRGATFWFTLPAA
jgi:two-component system, NtrC family, sensor histidine kinase KinB